MAILTTIRRPNQVPHVLLVSQFRPPVGRVILELPAGLIDPGEESDEGTKRAALRELGEETGYGTSDASHTVDGKLLSGIQFNDPGLTNATMKLCTVEIELAEDAPEPVAHPDEGEYIERHLLPLPTLYEELQRTCIHSHRIPHEKLCGGRASGASGDRLQAGYGLCR